ncbi:MAG: hypothetical protein APU95_01200 [Hadesarchaea archaeon YNP_N21]|jgi:hypothetical protein|nr:MAG: hypothetical protein APU95_01200 [Hadesarchaea archaeon YNP_N21]
MKEVETKLIWETFSSVMAYLAYPQDIKPLIEKTAGESQNVENFMEKFKLTIAAEEDPTKKTDARIFLNELRRAWGRASSKPT